MKPESKLECAFNVVWSDENPEHTTVVNWGKRFSGPDKDLKSLDEKHLKDSIYLKEVKFGGGQFLYIFEFSSECTDAHRAFLKEMSACQRSIDPDREETIENESEETDSILYYISFVMDQWLAKVPKSCEPICRFYFIAGTEECDAFIEFFFIEIPDLARKVHFQSRIVKNVITCLGNNDKKPKMLVFLGKKDFFVDKLWQFFHRSKQTSFKECKINDCNADATTIPPMEEEPCIKQKALYFAMEWTKQGNVIATTSAKASWNLANFNSINVKGESLDTVRFHRGDSDELVLELDLSQPVLKKRGRVLGLFVNEVCSVAESFTGLINQRIAGSGNELASKIFTFASYLIEQWLLKTDKRFEPTVRCRIGFFAGDKMEVRCECFIKDKLHSEVTPQWELNRQIMQTFVKAAEDLDSKLPNVLWAIKTRINRHNRITANGGGSVGADTADLETNVDYSKYVIEDIMKLVNTAATPTLRDKAKKVSWWLLVNVVPGVRFFIDGWNDIKAGNYWAGAGKFAAGAADVAVNVMSFFGFVRMLKAGGLALTSACKGIAAYTLRKTLKPLGN